MDASTVAEHRRLAILRHLEALEQFVSNASILGDVLRGVGIPTTEDQLRATLAWLQEAGLARYSEREGFTIVEITGRGAEVARGEAVHPGVRRPRPRD